MAVYRLCWLGPTGKVEAVQTHSFDTDAGAILAARTRLEREEHWVEGVEIWRDNLRIHVETRKARPRRPRKGRRSGAES